MIDLKRTVALVRGALFQPEATWREYLPEAGDWKKTALLLTGPLIVASALIAYLVGFLGTDVPLFGRFRPTLLSTVWTIVIGAVGAAVTAFIFSALSGLFKGKKEFALGLAATSLAFVPGYVGQAFSGIPGIGFLIALGLGIYGLVLLWKIIPIYLEVPDDSRVGHYILSLIATVVAMVVLSFVVGGAMFAGGGQSALGSLSGSESSGSSTGAAGGGGLLGRFGRFAELMEAAENDTYDPPSNGRLADGQVREFVRVMGRSAEIRGDQEARMKELAKRAEDDDISFAEAGEMLGSVPGMAGLATAEMEVVKSGGGNWAEHQWVRGSLRAAYLQQDLNGTTAHNYKIYKKYEADLATHIAN